MSVTRGIYYNLWLFIGLFTIVLAQTKIPQETVKYDDNIAEESSHHHQQNNNNNNNNNGGADMITSYILPNNIFNNGKPFYGAKDPVSGIIDFNPKKNGNLETYIDEDKDYDDIKSINSNDISQISTNFHDYLNLPVKYTASKFVYPLVSSSYSNLKYQGNNKNFTSNHKNYTTTTTVQPPVTLNKYQGGNYNYKQTTNNYRTSTTKVPNYTLKPRPITTSPIKFAPSSTHKPYPYRSTTTTTTPHHISSTIKYTEVTDKIKEDKPIKFNKDKYEKENSVSMKIPASVATTTTTKQVNSSTPTITAAAATTTTKLTTVSSSSTDRPQTTMAHTTFKPIPTLASQTTSGTMTLADLFNALGVEDVPEVIPFENNEQNSIIELNVNNLNGPTNPQNFNIPSTNQQFNNFNGAQQDTKPNHSNQNNNNFNGIQNSIPPRNDYVKYEQNHQNNLQYAPVSSMNNIVISPDQDSAAFVLGSQQSVGTSNNYIDVVNTKDTFINSPGPQYQVVGTVIGENNFHDFKPQGFKTQNNNNNNDNKNQNEIKQTPQTQQQQLQKQQQQQKQQDYKNTNVRFPNDPQNNAPIVTGTYKTEILSQNGHSSPPIALPHSQIVVFPPNEKMPVEQVNSELHLNLPDQIKNRVVFEHDNNYNKKNNHPAKKDNHPPNFHHLPENLTPPFENKYVRNPASTQNQNGPQTRPNGPNNNNNNNNNNNRISQYGNNEHIRKPVPGFSNNRPMPDRPLPNILPQFRPTTKESHGHQYNRETVNVRIPPPPQQQVGPPPPFRRQNADNMVPPHTPIFNGRLPMPQQMPPQMPPQSYNQIRRTQNPNRFNNKMAPAAVMPMPIDPMEQLNRRYYRVPQPQINDRIFGPPPVPNLPQKRFPAVLHRHNNQQLINQQINSKSDNLQQPFESDDFYKNPPQISRHPIEEPQDQIKMEPVVTLQMIQSKKVLSQDQTVNNLTNGQNEPLLNTNSPAGKNPLYVVYPIKSGPMKHNVITTESPIVIGQRGDNPPLPPPAALGSITGYQNTPFTIHNTHNEQEPILMAKDKPFRTQFPYQLIKANPLTIAELDQSHHKKGELTEDIYNTGESPADDGFSRVLNKGNQQHFHIDDEGDDDFVLSSSSLGKMTRKPIAIAYTPTEPPRYYDNYHPSENTFSMPNYAGPIISEILDQESPGVNLQLNNYDRDELGYPSHGNHNNQYNQDFQAPFFASVNADGVIKNSYEGWSIVSPSSTQSSIQKNQINRSDTESNSEKTDEHDKTEDEHSIATTKKFNADTFQPELESGFKPIIPSTPIKLVPAEPMKKSSTIEDSIASLFSSGDENDNDEDEEDLEDSTTNNSSR